MTYDLTTAKAEGYVQGVNDVLEVRKELQEEGDCDCNECLREHVGVYRSEDDPKPCLR